MKHMMSQGEIENLTLIQEGRTVFTLSGNQSTSWTSGNSRFLTGNGTVSSGNSCKLIQALSIGLALGKIGLVRIY
jgi:hypothetical protein